MFGFGDIIRRREMLDGREWIVYPVRVVEDTEDHLAVYLAKGTPLTFGQGDFRWGTHPWANFDHIWQSDGVLQVQRPGDGYSVWHFWKGDTFSGWYINFQEPMRRDARGFDTLDQELDIWVPADGSSFQWKDVEHFEERERLGGFHPGEADAVRTEAQRVVAMLDAGTTWWSDRWTDWSAPAIWEVPGRMDLSAPA
ncbi:DUF402 domain-containing protein [Streptomyces sp. WAC 01529]|uniref:DUF402 domain-containing protein n=1 Tax=Streptomyces sp. WAC 01529 TaxID=2203205 RepID=UPI000F71E7E9|nr:DUF402 domain-containing protein [Streptomyces sp. WAC 01529]AZM58128.1 DUF402 domain-containing protein [Streptomyces sp. WAC 01529]